MKKFLISVYFLLFYGCSTISLVKIPEKDKINLTVLSSLMNYPDLKISNFKIKDHEHLHYSSDFESLSDTKNSAYIYVDESSFNNNINFIKDLFIYNKKLYRILIAYSLTQGASFKAEVLSYLEKQKIMKNFSLKINFPTAKKFMDNKYWIVIAKNHLDSLVKSKNYLVLANVKMEYILKKFLT
ncbi:hypothetical protein CV643_05325 [Borreliella burgdorferi]|uniref:hypothetical protein n=1 Tax=Borreliella burgdorferi TaxID=139 RepID=UPI000BC3547F|nr:hypothetical protein [Borreliella burgdorferi]ATH10421.1 hypothetical protein BHT49_04400 [Borreliella burgdorferi]MCD2418219.1 hypothetical protein [Borreliella burgdorferi]MCD2420796.1 hypothetical protein [Borreliella burgdorferi]PRQ92092.1 hypothetical protein CV690_05340 [Borreliella burgdorferi]PRQ97612.1 hypothetical protein CV674_04800 [Borreliella burgdorferi]